MSALSESTMTTPAAVLKNGEDNDRILSDAVRQKTLQTFTQAVAEIEKILALDSDDALSTNVAGMSVAAMSAHARSRAGKQKTRREIAVVLATSALHQADNPLWNPFDPATETDAAQASQLLQWLLQ